jgi:hypothetical protein
MNISDYELGGFVQEIKGEEAILGEHSCLMSVTWKALELKIRAVAIRMRLPDLYEFSADACTQYYLEGLDLENKKSVFLYNLLREIAKINRPSLEEYL